MTLPMEIVKMVTKAAEEVPMERVIGVMRHGASSDVVTAAGTLWLASNDKDRYAIEVDPRFKSIFDRYRLVVAIADVESALRTQFSAERIRLTKPDQEYESAVKADRA